MLHSNDITPDPAASDPADTVPAMSPTAASRRTGPTPHPLDGRTRAGSQPSTSPPTIDEPAAPAATAAADPDAARFDAVRFRLRRVEMGLTPAYNILDEHGETCCHAQRETHLSQRVAAIVAAVLICIGAVLPVVAMAMGVSSLAVRLSILLAGGAMSVVLGGIALAALWPKRHILFFTSLDQPRELMVLLQDQRVGVVSSSFTLADAESARPWLQSMGVVSSSFTLADADLNLIGWFSRAGRGDGLLRQRWHCYDGEGELRCIVTEDAMWKSVLRHIFLIGGANFLPTCYLFKQPVTDLVLARFDRFKGKEDLLLRLYDQDTARTLDRRLVVALAVLLDQLEGT